MIKLYNGDQYRVETVYGTVLYTHTFKDTNTYSFDEIYANWWFEKLRWDIGQCGPEHIVRWKTFFKYNGVAVNALCLKPFLDSGYW